MSNAGRTPKVASLGDACCGCGACAARCPESCISMEPDEWGFLHPSADVASCIGCGACDSVCPVLNIPDGDGCDSVLWAKARDADLLDRSSSGGVFGLLGRDVISRGGVVVGAAWHDGCCELRHVVVGDVSDLDSVMRSKYVQSSVGRGVYEGVRGALRCGRPALFAGTACQVAAMRSYLGALADSGLFLAVDVVCHGVPSPGLWRRWLGHVERRERGEVLSVNFRSKVTGWLSYSVVYECAAGEGGASRSCASKSMGDWYMRAFLRNASLRLSCLRCPFKRRCGSDVTLGDYWGVQRQHPEAPVERGVSAVVCGTGRGTGAVSRVFGFMDCGTSSLDGVIAGNPALVRPSAPYSGRDAFMAAFAEGMPIEKMMARWDFEPGLGERVVSKVRGVAGRLFGRA